MNETVTVDEAISKGHRMISYPFIGIIFGTIIFTAYLNIQRLIPNWSYPVSFVVAFFLGWIWCSYMITKWKIWAYDNVRNVHELKKRAIQEKLIWADNSFFAKTEMRTVKDKEKLKSLQNKFKKDDIFQDDLTVPFETLIYYSRTRSFLEMVGMLCVLVVGSGIVLDMDGYFIHIMGVILLIIGLLFSYKKYKDATNKEPQIIINDKGIKTVTTGFHDWKDIENEEVITEGTGKNTHYYLTYGYPKGTERLQIDDYNTNKRSLNKLLILYRARYKKKTMSR
jgi:sulfite exporter TauE/SafE